MPTRNYKRIEIVSATGEKYLRGRFSNRCWALAPVFIGWLVLCAPAMAGPFGVSLAANGGTGETACAGSSFLLTTETNSTLPNPSLTYTNSATGYNNAPICSNQIASSFVNANAALGDLSALATAGLTGSISPLPGSTTTATWNDTFTADVTGQFLIAFTLNDSETATQASCPSSPQAQVMYFVSVTIGGNPAAGANWNNTDCAPNAGPGGEVGDVVFSNKNSVYFDLSLTAGTVFDVSGDLTVSALVAQQQSPGVSDGVTANVGSALFQITGDYTSASGKVYGIADIPEPASWLLTGIGLAALGLRVRRRSNSG